MNTFKNTILALLVLANGAALAGTMGPVCTEGNATIPCDHHAWDIGVQALYLQPVYSNANFLMSQSNSNSVRHWERLQPAWGWGYKLEGSSHFNTGNDIDVNWYHYNNTNQYHSILGTATLPIGVTTTLNPKWDAVNAELGQQLDFGLFKALRLYGGAQYAQVIQNITNVSPGLRSEQLFVQFNGFGPRLGADMSYAWGQGFSVYANGATALLLGNNKFNTTTSGIIDITGASYSTATVAVPEVEGKLGAKYTYLMAQGDLSLDIGYMWLNYINAQTFLTTSRLGGTADFALGGPYVGLKWLATL